MSSRNGNNKVVILLLEDPRVDPSVSDTIKSASYNGHSTVVELLLADPRVDPSADDNYAIRWALKKDTTRSYDFYLQILE